MLVNKVYRYGVIPKTNRKLVEDQIFYNHLYYNGLVNIVNWKEQYYSFLSNKGIEHLEEKVSSTFSEVKIIKNKIKEERIKSRSKKDSPELLNELKAAEKINQEAYDIYNKARKENRKNIPKEEQNRIKELTAHLVKELRKYYVEKYNLYWGSYSFTEDAIDDAEKSLYKKHNRRKGLIKFKSFDKTGKIGVHLQSSVDRSINRSASDIFNINSDYYNYLFIKMYDKPEYVKGKENCGKRSQQKGLLRIRIGSEKKQKVDKKGNLIFKKDGSKQMGKEIPIFAEFDIIFHRQLPENSIIKYATINKKRYGNKIEWTLNITVEFDEIKPQNINGKSIAYDLGWRHEKNNVYRIAAWTDSDGNNGIEKMNFDVPKKAEDLKSIIDDQFNFIKDLLSNYSKQTENLPQWLVEKSNYILKYRSCNKLIKLFKFWKNNRFDGDEDIFMWLNEWKRKNVHLSNWMYGSQRSFLRYRKQTFATLAKKVSENYQYVVFEDLKLDNMAKGKVAGGQRQKVSPSEFKEVFKYRFMNENILKINAKNTSKIHNDCGSIEELDDQKTQQKCSKCGIEFDRDINAAKNILGKGKKIIRRSIISNILQ